jgi:hypothetical protein
MSHQAGCPRLSVVVNFHNMQRESIRTLHTLSTNYQRGVGATDYEVIAVDNGSLVLWIGNGWKQMAPISGACALTMVRFRRVLP